MEDRMYGVVLWSDESDRKAVIWCEDQGNLAYYSAPDQTMHQGVALDAGDLIQFQLFDDPDCRRACNPERVNAGYAPGLAKSLTENCGPAEAPDASVVAASQDRADNVIPFRLRA